MPWNQPGSGGNGEDPWGQNNRGGGGRNQGPPDLDEVFKQAKDRLDSMFSRRRGGGGGDDDDNNPYSGQGSPVGKGAVLAVLGVLFGFWVFTGFYTVDQGEQAIELRFGEYSETNGAGLHWQPT